MKYNDKQITEFMNEETIILPKRWFENLLKYAKKTDELSKEQDNQDQQIINNLKINLPNLLGYIDSVELILKRN